MGVPPSEKAGGGWIETPDDSTGPMGTIHERSRRASGAGRHRIAARRSRIYGSAVTEPD